ncbi:hypothetical protein [Notoacmeibacter marinus]|nr:hypothetical protein [Notoacmeibacter marinus]
MLQWLSNHSGAISTILSAMMLAVWITYLQLLFIQFRAGRRSSILITRAAGKGMRSRCLVTNMSAQPLYVTSLIGTLHIAERQIELSLTDLRDLPEDLGQDPRSKMAQGSLNTGEFLDIGHFDDIVSAMLEANDEEGIDVDHVDQLDLTVVALYAPESLPVGASRRFRFDRQIAKGPKVMPLNVRTDQIRSKRRRRELLAKVRAHT